MILTDGAKIRRKLVFVAAPSISINPLPAIASVRYSVSIKILNLRSKQPQHLEGIRFNEAEVRIA